MDKLIFKTKYVEHVFRTLKKITTEVIKLPRGGQVLPYFKDSKNAWKIVLVSQYRPAVKKKTLEGAGGRLDNEPAKEALSRELQEETGIKVKPSSIRTVFHEYAHPSILNASIFGGIAKINADMVTNKKKTGKKRENERTQVEIFDLVGFLKNREEGLVEIDLLTSRLLDEVAKAVGLLIKKY